MSNVSNNTAVLFASVLLKQIKGVIPSADEIAALVGEVNADDA